MGRSSHFTSGSGGSLAPVLTGLLAEPVPCDVVNTAQEAPRQTARRATEWARIVCLDMWLTLTMRDRVSGAKRSEATLASGPLDRVVRRLHRRARGYGVTGQRSGQV